MRLARRKSLRASRPWSASSAGVRPRSDPPGLLTPASWAGATRGYAPSTGAREADPRLRFSFLPSGVEPLFCQPRTSSGPEPSPSESGAAASGAPDPRPLESSAADPSAADPDRSDRSISTPGASGRIPFAPNPDADVKCGLAGRAHHQAVGDADLCIIAGQLGRPPRDVTGIAVRCPFGRPAVIETAPVLSDGTPNTTLLYLTCPTLTVAVSRSEAGGGVQRLRDRCHSDGRLRAHLDVLTALYQERRASLAGDGRNLLRPAAGIGGLRPRAGLLSARVHGGPLGRAGWGGSGERGRRRVRYRGGAGVGRPSPEPEGAWCTDDRCGRAAAPRRRAVLDIGTISVRLLVADVTCGRVEEVARRVVVTRIGEGLRPGGRLLPAAAARTAEAVFVLAAEARRWVPDEWLLAGTSAIREAEDGRNFLAGLGEDLAVPTVVLTSRREAELAYLGVGLDIPGDPVLLDIGGGSTELSRRQGIRFDSVSLDIGAAKAGERWPTTDPPRPEQIETIQRETRRLLEPIGDRFRSRPERPGVEARLVGVAGTVVTLACLSAGLKQHDRDALHLRTLTRQQVQT